MYVQFSQPMKTIGNLEKIRLIDAQGNDIHGAIFNNVYELWDQNQELLTLLLDPARVKTGLEANKSMGRALRSGNTYQLIIEGLEDINHQKMKERFVKEINIVGADTIAPATDLWVIKTPRARSLSELEIKFPDMLDWISMQHRLIVKDYGQEIVQGSISIAEKERCWKLTPKKPWEPGNYTLHINARLEDPSGNNLNGPFDHKSGSLQYESEDEVVELSFTITE